MPLALSLAAATTAYVAVLSEFSQQQLLEKTVGTAACYNSYLVCVVKLTLLVIMWPAGSYATDT